MVVWAAGVSAVSVRLSVSWLTVMVLTVAVFVRLLGMLLMQLMCWWCRCTKVLPIATRCS